MKYHDYAEGEEHRAISEYDITIVPSDFNVMTLKSLVDRKWVQIPGFQRNYVWSIKQASWLIESLILGLPVPQLFLYQKEQNRNILIDGHQRLMSIYYFMEQRFPRNDRRPEIRRIFDKHGRLPNGMIENEEYFQDFTLQLPKNQPTRSDSLSDLNGVKYEDLNDDQKSRLDLRTIRCIFVRQNMPEGDDSSMYEIFNRLNSGGTKLTPQEIRASMYHSEFLSMLNRINLHEGWRRLLGRQNADLRMKDVEILLRGFAMLIDHDNYRSSMVKFLNAFSRKCENNDNERNNYLEKLFISFISATSEFPESMFAMTSGRFSVSLYEAVFSAICELAHNRDELVQGRIDVNKLAILKEDAKFVEASQKRTTHASSVRVRIDRAKAILA